MGLLETATLWALGVAKFSSGMTLVCVASDDLLNLSNLSFFFSATDQLCKLLFSLRCCFLISKKKTKPSTALDCCRDEPSTRPALGTSPGTSGPSGMLLYV